MALESNVMELISPAAAAIPGTVSATLSRLSTWRGEDADGAFDERIDALAGSVDPDAAARVTVERIDMGNPAACYWSVSGESLGRSIRARLVLPSGQGAHPLILMFHDAGRPVRDWHHMTRFAGVGMAVLALDQEEGPFEDVLLDAIALKAATRAVSVLDPSSISTWGEGLGGALALGVAALSGGDIARCAAANPCAPALCGDCGSLVHLARRIVCPTLVGTGLMDAPDKVEDQFALVNRMGCPCRHIIYPKHGRERINAFEDRALAYLLSTE